MRSRNRKITQSINYLARHLGEGVFIPELKIIKLVWAADRYHLRRYARTVTDDNYVAMAKGPVGSITKDTIEFETNYKNVNDEDLRYNERFIKFYQENGNGYVCAIDATDEEELSETDVEALKFALAKFGAMSTQEIVDFTHKYPEWKKHERTLLCERKVVAMNLLDFYLDPEDVSDDPFKMRKDILNASLSVFREYV